MAEATNDADILRVEIDRHQNLCTALPFPQRNADEDDASYVKRLHAFAVGLSNSAIDWYLEKRRPKKFLAQTIHWIGFVLIFIAALFPLFKILSHDIQIKLLGTLFDAPDKISETSAEVALILIGLAGGIHVIDRTAGFSTAWMRYVRAAFDISEALTQFELAWADPSIDKPKAAPPPAPTKAKKGAATDCFVEAPVLSPIEIRLRLLNEHCQRLFKIVSSETANWATELSERVKEIESRIKTR